MFNYTYCDQRHYVILPRAGVSITMAKTHNISPFIVSGILLPLTAPCGLLRRADSRAKIGLDQEYTCCLSCTDHSCSEAEDDQTTQGFKGKLQIRKLRSGGMWPPERFYVSLNARKMSFGLLACFNRGYTVNVTYKTSKFIPLFL